MQIRTGSFALGLLVGAALATGAIVGSARAAATNDDSLQPAVGGQSTATIVLDNARVRVRDVTFPPGPTGMHTHELAHVGVVIQGGTLVFKYPDRTSETAKLEAGGVGFREANVTHAPVNTGTTPVRVIEVELR